MFFGLIVLALGIIFLMQNLGYISGSVWEIIWPSALIIMGLVILFRNKGNCADIFRRKK